MHSQYRRCQWPTARGHNAHHCQHSPGGGPQGSSLHRRDGCRRPSPGPQRHHKDSLALRVEARPQEQPEVGRYHQLEGPLAGRGGRRRGCQYQGRSWHHCRRVQSQCRSAAELDNWTLLHFCPLGRHRDLCVETRQGQGVDRDRVGSEVGATVPMGDSGCGRPATALWRLQVRLRGVHHSEQTT
jgi:hypothetical protein